MIPCYPHSTSAHFKSKVAGASAAALRRGPLPLLPARQLLGPLGGPALRGRGGAAAARHPLRAAAGPRPGAGGVHPPHLREKRKGQRGGRAGRRALQRREAASAPWCMWCSIWDLQHLQLYYIIFMALYMALHMVLYYILLYGFHAIYSL